MIKNFQFSLKTKGFNDIIDISQNVLKLIKESNITNGNALVFSPGSTCGITTIEYETGAVEDFKRFFERIAPQNLEYNHNMRWHDGNGFSHVRAALLKSSFVFPIIDSKPILGTWQQIVFVDFDNCFRTRDIIVQVNGE